jgi:hypothetical protein
VGAGHTEASGPLEYLHHCVIPVGVVMKTTQSYPGLSLALPLTGKRKSASLAAPDTETVLSRVQRKTDDERMVEGARRAEAEQLSLRPRSTASTYASHAKKYVVFRVGRTVSPKKDASRGDSWSDRVCLAVAYWARNSGAKNYDRTTSVYRPIDPQFELTKDDVVSMLSLVEQDKLPRLTEEEARTLRSFRRVVWGTESVSKREKKAGLGSG